MSWWSFRPYVSVAQRQVKAKREVEKLRKKERTITPVQIAGREIATTFWGSRTVRWSNPASDIGGFFETSAQRPTCAAHE